LTIDESPSILFIRSSKEISSGNKGVAQKGDAMSTVQLVVFGWFAISLMMIILCFVQRRTADAGIVDVGWAAGIGALAIFYALAGPGLLERRLMIGGMAAFWSFRLATYLLKDRVLAGEEDGRYQALREKWGRSFNSRIYWFFQAQGLLSVLFSLPLLVAMSSPREQLGLIDGVALLIWLVAVGGESLADRQLAAFRAESSNRGRTCRTGLWKVSRHPNYFFEWLHWWSYAVAAVGATWWWLALAAPMIMLFFILFVTGIPPTEARALRSRGEDYRDYQRTTSAFLPWFPKAVEE
jgi:steroid 5-alpha reductase family enzyme